MTEFLETLMKPGESMADLREFFMLNVTRDESGCWLFGRTRGQYGNFRGHAAHRVSWELHQGAIPEGLHILHGCNIVADLEQPTRSCVNPAHLRPGTASENARDVTRAKALARTKAAPPTEDPVSITLQFKGKSALAWHALAKHHGLETQELFWLKAVPLALMPWFSGEVAKIAQRYPVAIGRAVGGTRFNGELTDPASGATCVASGASLRELRENLRLELAACSESEPLATIAKFDETGKTPDVCALLEAERDLGDEDP